MKNVRKLYRIACEIEDTDHLTAFDVGGEIGPERALYTTKKIPAETRAGLVTIPLDGTQMVNVNRLLGWPNQGVLRRDEGVGVRTQSASGLYRPLNMFELPGFAYPVLLLDTSTFEGRALSLMTFTPDGAVTQFRVYEYVINC